MSKISKWWKNFLERLAEASKEEYGNKPPSCCDGKKKGEKATQDPSYRTQAK